MNAVARSNWEDSDGCCVGNLTAVVGVRTDLEASPATERGPEDGSRRHAERPIRDLDLEYAFVSHMLGDGAPWRMCGRELVRGGLMVGLMDHAGCLQHGQSSAPARVGQANAKAHRRGHYERNANASSGCSKFTKRSGSVIQARQGSLKLRACKIEHFTISWHGEHLFLDRPLKSR